MLIGKNRLRILHRIEKVLATPMAVFGLIWIALMVVKLGWGLSRFGDIMVTLIWMIFILDFLLRLTIAPRKLRYLRRNWLTVITLVLPALRIVRFTGMLRVLVQLRGWQLVRILGSINRGMQALDKAMRRRGLGYILALTLIVIIAGAAGMLSFEKNLPQGAGLNDFGTAIWWTAMIMTTMGTDYWPRTPEGRILCLFLAIYAFAMFGYVTGAIASYFVGRDAVDEDTIVEGSASIEVLRKDITAEITAEISALRDEIREMKNAR